MDGLTYDSRGDFVGVIDGYYFPFSLTNQTRFTYDFPPEGVIATILKNKTDAKVLEKHGVEFIDVILGRDLLEKYRDALIRPRRISGMECDPVFGKPRKEPDPNLCFVLMPFSEPWSERIWRRHLKPNIERAGFLAIRADDIYSTNVLMSDIWDALCAASVIVADLTGNNPNVLYELGIAHTLGKRVIIICQEHSRRPFDTSHWRQILYQDNSEGCEILENAVEETLKIVREELGLDEYSVHH